MKSAGLRLAVAAMTTAAMLWIAGVAPLYAQSAPKGLTLWVDQRTGQVFVRPGKGRRALQLPAAINTEELEQRVQRKVNEQAQQTIQKENQQLRAQLQSQQHQTQQIATQIKEIEPAWQDYAKRWKDKFSLSATMFADWRVYTHTSFQPQEITQINNPGPGNELFNSIDITRTYINLFFHPAPGWTARITPNIYRQYNSGGSVNFGKTSTLGSNLNGNLGFRLKYAYVEYSKLLDRSPWLKGAKISFGQVTNPLVDWEEHLYGYRFTSLIPWNYLSLSSTQAGLKLAGPVRLWGGEKKYIDYAFGVYNNASFHTFEQNNVKSVMGRVSVYPLGFTGKLNGLGFTGFYGYYWDNKAPDSFYAHQTRIAALVHYTSKRFGLAFEYDAGHNAFSSGHLFSGSAPNPASAEWGPMGSLASSLLNQKTADQQGFDLFGHYNIPGTKFSIFGMGMWFLPNTKVEPDPFDFQHLVLGVAYKYNKHLKFALDSQNTLFYHEQSLYSKIYNVFPAVPRDTHAVFLNLEFDY